MRITLQRHMLSVMGQMAGAERPRGWASLPHTDSDPDVQKRLELIDEASVEVQVLSHGMSFACHGQR